MSRRYILAITLSVVNAAALHDVALTAEPSPQTAQRPSDKPQDTLLGQTATPLADGRWLVTGGQGPNGPLYTVSIFDPSTGTSLELAARLNEARAWHTATVLADGNILIVGGRGPTGEVLSTAERFDPNTNTSIAVEIAGRPRAGHTTTLLTDGRVLVVGGETAPGPTDAVAEVWNVDARTVAPVAGGKARALHTATLLGDGCVLLVGGTDSRGNSVRDVEVFDPRTNAVAPLRAPLPDDGGIPVVMETRPSAGATDVPVDAIVTLRLSHAVRIDAVTEQHVNLSGPDGTVSSLLVSAEGGRLVFVRPSSALAPDTKYSVNIIGVTDQAGVALVANPVTFTTGKTDKTDSEIWMPSQPSGDGWRMNLPASPWQQLKPLQAPPGVTALAGQVLRLNGQPLAGVTFDVEGHSARSDGTGRFLVRLDGVSEDHVELWVDARTANRRDAVYGTYEIGVPIRDKETTALPYTIWMPALDVEHAVTIPSPTRSEFVITTPMIPGLELRLPPDAVIRDHDGALVRTVTITPVPLDRPPFPLPGVDVPVYFTVQPGGAYIYVSGTTGQRGARLIYPNRLGLPVGAHVNFWHYDAEGPGWYVYGEGRVPPPGLQIVPNPGVEFYEFTGSMAESPGFAPSRGPHVGDPYGEDGEPVDLNTGLFIVRKTDLALPDVIPLALTRTYRPADTQSRAFGIGTSQPYDVFLVGNNFPYTFLDLILEDGARIHYDRISPGGGFDDAIFEHVSTPTVWYKSSIAWNGGGWTLTRKDGTVWTFNEGFQATRFRQGALTSIRDRFGNTVTLTRDSNFDLTGVTSPNGRSMTLTYDASDRITQAQDNIGRTVNYVYDASGRLWKVTDPEGGVTEYGYDATHRMVTIKDARGIVFVTNVYDANDRVTQQTLADQTTYLFAYTEDGQGRVIQTDVTNPRGFVRRVTFNTDGYSLTQVEALGTPLARTTTLTREVGSQFVTAMVDGLNRRTEFTYDGTGHLERIKRLAGTPDVATTTYTYEPAFFQLASITDTLGHAWTTNYDTAGKVTGVDDPLGQHWTVTVNPAGRVTIIADPQQQTWQLAYTAGDLTSITDPLGAVRRQFVDGGGRVLSVTNGLGQVTRFTWDRLNQLMNVTDALDGAATIAHDPNGNVLSLSDALTHATNYTYDVRDRVSFRTDPVTHSESRIYDGNGNLTQLTDRKSQLSSYEYDSLDRLSTVTYSDTSTIAYSYDAGDRLTQIVDSINGTMTFTYNGLDRLTQETTPLSTLNYTYDTAGRRTTMTVTGQAVVSYGYDEADRLTSVTQNGTSVTMTYDGTGRRTGVTWPNGVVASSGYDGSGQLTSLVYTLGTLTLGNLIYTYDAAGNRLSVGGSWARTSLPPPLQSSTYDAANRILSWGPAGFTYDFNGNLTTDASAVYTWNARDQLSGFAGSAIGSFFYDGLGRRRAKAIGGISTDVVYDGLNPVQELSGGTPMANLLTGLSVDETFARTDAGGSSALLTDALGSTLAVADVSGTVQTEYTYGPFGATTSTGAPSTNAAQFTGRENDGTGLYFSRARYYNPSLQRFTSEDPLGFVAGDVNLFTYVGNTPTRHKDPMGMVAARFPPGTFPACERLSGPKPATVWDRFRCDLELGELLLLPGMVGEVAGFTRHGINRVIGRGITPQELLEALRSIRQGPFYDSLGREFYRYVGPRATVIVNSAGQVITTW